MENCGEAVPSGKWKVENGKWKVESGKWKMESGKWKMESGKWKMESGKWKVESGKWKVESGKWKEVTILGRDIGRSFFKNWRTKIESTWTAGLLRHTILFESLVLISNSPGSPASVHLTTQQKVETAVSICKLSHHSGNINT